MRNHGRKVDNNHRDIRSALRAAGFITWDCSQFGKGLPDLMLNLSGHICFLEVKSPGERLTDDERKFFDDFAGCLVTVVYGTADALRYCGTAASGLMAV